MARLAGRKGGVWENARLGGKAGVRAGYGVTIHPDRVVGLVDECGVVAPKLFDFRVAPAGGAVAFVGFGFGQGAEAGQNDFGAFGVVLMVVVGGVERRGIQDWRDDFVVQGGFGFGFFGFGDFAFGGRVHENGSRVGWAAVAELAAGVGRVDGAKEGVEQVAIAEFVGVIGDLHSFDMAGIAFGDLFIGRVGDFTAGKPGYSVGNAGQFFQIMFDAPETAACDGCGFQVGGVGLAMLGGEPDKGGGGERDYFDVLCEADHGRLRWLLQAWCGVGTKGASRGRARSHAVEQR